MSPQEEIAQLRAQMRNPSAWFKNTQGQARYRELVRIHGNEPPPPEAKPATAQEMEMQQLRQAAAAPQGSAEWMSYWRGPGAVRYREILDSIENPGDVWKPWPASAE